MKNEIRSSNVISNMAWRFAERVGAQGITFIVSLILARILDPSIYGSIALVTAFISILQVFIDCGLGNALIQKRNADNLDFSSVFYFNIGLGIILYIIIYLFAPVVADFYSDKNLTLVLRVLGSNIIISGIKNIQQAFISRTLQFRKFFISTLAGTLVAVFIGIFLAYKGAGVWALVFQNLTNNIIDMIILWITAGWRPSKDFSWYRLKILLNYGWKILVSGFIDSVYDNIRQFVIGKKYTSQELAFYNRGKQFPAIVVTNINASIDSVLFPTMSNVQSDIIRLREMTRKSICVSSYIMCPLMFGLAVIAEDLVALILTEKWIPCVPYLKIFCITYALHPILTANLNAIKALGRSDIFLKLDIIRKLYGMGILIITMRFGPLIIAYGMLISEIVSSFVNAFPNKKLLQYRYSEQIKDIFPSLLSAIIMSIVIYLVGSGIDNYFLCIFVQIISGCMIYLFESILIKPYGYIYIRNLISVVFKKKAV